MEKATPEDVRVLGKADIPEKPEQEHKREKWTNKIDFLLACIGFSVGLGNVWRFPYLCYKNGGGAFLLPYLICALIGGIPLFILEVALGQFMGIGGVGTWSICPLFKGIGFACAIIVFLLNCYYNVILCWAFYYMFASFTSVLPWSSCDNPWNTENCSIAYNKTANGTRSGVDPVNEYWENRVLGISGGIDEVGEIRWDLALCLLLAWIVVYFCIWKGIRSSGKVMYFTATTPYILMFTLLIRGTLLDGAVDGIIYYLKPEWNRLLDIEVWVDAGTQIFYSYSIGIGTLTALGSYNEFHHNSYRDSIIFALTNSGTSILAGFVIFSVLGFMANEQGVAIKDVAASGPGLAFIAYPKAVAQMPVAPLWSAIFFFMVILLGLDSQFVGVEGFVTACVDAFPKLLRKGHRKEIFVAFVCLISYFVGLSMCTNGGMYVFQLFDYYSGSRIVLLVAFFECLVVAWIYGIRRFYDNLLMMYGFRINYFMYGMWTIGAPLFCLVIFVLSSISYSELTYDRKGRGKYIYPDWAVGIGWAMACVSVVFIPITMAFQTIKTVWKGKPLRTLIEPEGLQPHQLRPQDYPPHVEPRVGRPNPAYSNSSINKMEMNVVY
ncbi:sodium- and chloride-dependent creatine transporter 1-like isoform X2 [Lineus longissimus]